MRKDELSNLLGTSFGLNLTILHTSLIMLLFLPCTFINLLLFGYFYQNLNPLTQQKDGLGTIFT